jgi:hypothetical protein
MKIIFMFCKNIIWRFKYHKKKLNDENIENKEKSSLQTLSKNFRIRVSLNCINDKLKQKIFFKMIAYENDIERQKFDEMFNKFSNILKNEEFINVSKKKQ